MSRSQIYYSDRYNDDQYEYRHVVLPREMAKYIPRSHLMSEEEWRKLGVQQSQGWIHYMIHEPAPHPSVQKTSNETLIQFHYRSSGGFLMRGKKSEKRNSTT